MFKNLFKREKQKMKTLTSNQAKYLINILSKHVEKIHDTAWEDDTKKVRHLKACDNIKAVLKEMQEHPTAQLEQVETQTFDKIHFMNGNKIVGTAPNPMISEVKI